MDDPSSDFQSIVDDAVLDKIVEGTRQFDRLLRALPGLYPAILRDSLNNLQSKGKITSNLHSSIVRRTELNPDVDTVLPTLLGEMPTPHPLDFDWRFTANTSKTLARICVNLTQAQDRIVYLGCPSVFGTSANGNYRREFLLIDRNPEYARRWGNRCVRADLMYTPVEELGARLTLADPPWYQSYEHCFLSAASITTRTGGYVLTTTPATWTKKNVAKEWDSLLDLSQKLGLDYVGSLPHSVQYDAPYFELNSLRAAGLSCVARNWRRGDLALFRKTHNMRLVENHQKYHYDDWSQETQLGFRIRNHGNQQNRPFRDPSLLSIVSGDVLPSVSRTDPSRTLADIWTIGNRVFACRATDIFQRILIALEAGNSVLENVEAFVERSLTKSQITKLNHTSEQIIHIIALEKQELSRYEAS